MDKKDCGATLAKIATKTQRQEETQREKIAALCLQ